MPDTPPRARGYLRATPRARPETRRAGLWHLENVRRVVTIGVYGWNPRRFLAGLGDADVGLLVDVRQRRGVRGPEYAWANAVRLQAAVAQAGIAYRHEKQLAPTTELRHLQYAEDARQGVGKRSRMELAAEYRRRYTGEILDQFDLGRFVAGLPAEGASALLCVERDPKACHRSIITQRLEAAYDVKVSHLYVPERTAGTCSRCWCPTARWFGATARARWPPRSPQTDRRVTERPAQGLA